MYKNLKDSVFKTKAKWIYLLSILISMTYLYINAKSMLWISNVVENYQDPLYWLTIVILSRIIMMVIGSFMQLIKNIGRNKSYRYIYELYIKKILKANYKMFVDISLSDISTACSEIDDMINIPRILINFLQNVLILIINMIIMYKIEKKLILPIFLIEVFTMIFMYFLFKKYDKISSKNKEITRDENKEIDDIINGFSEVRTFNNIESHFNKIIGLNEKSNENHYKLLKLNGLISFTIDLIETIGVTMILLVGINGLRNEVIKGTEIIVLITYLINMLQPIINIVDEIDQVSDNLNSIKKVNEILYYEDEKYGNIELQSFDSSIEFKNLEFYYEESSKILKNVNLKINKGETIGICGPTGGGKSTLLKLIPRFYKTTSGSILIDGININNLEETSLRNHIGVVHQDPYIFNATIMENLKYADINATEEKIMEACKKASLYDFVMRLEKGFNTEVGARGIKLSGGQKQRIALARIFIKNPEIILLDEATSALDNETELIIQESLKAFKDKTLIIIAHRLSTIKDADKIIVIDEHTIKEQGTHYELCDLGGIYFNMYTAKEKNL